jgi:hypothetical protein
MVRSGRLRALAVTSPTRSRVLPDVPTFAEAGVPGLEVSIHYGVLAPAATPQEIVARLNAALVKGLNTAETRKRMDADGCRARDEHAGRIRQAHPDRDGQVGEGHQGGGHQARVDLAVSVRLTQASGASIPQVLLHALPLTHDE